MNVFCGLVHLVECNDVRVVDEAHDVDLTQERCRVLIVQPDVFLADRLQGEVFLGSGDSLALVHLRRVSPAEQVLDDDFLVQI